MVIRDLENLQAEEGGDVVLLCQLSKPGLPVEWKKGTVVLSCGEKYQMKETGLSYELQIFDLKPCDSGCYSCSSGDTISSASLVVNGRMETSFHAFLLNLCSTFFSISLYFFIAILDLVLLINFWLFLYQLPKLFSQKSLKAKRWMKGTVWGCTVSFLNLGFLWSGEKENSDCVLVQSMTLDKQDTWLHL